MRESLLAAQAFSRAAGAPLIEGNRVRVLKDADENYPAWQAAIASARSHVFFETYILHNDREGNRFAELLLDQAARGVVIYLLYDWLGGIGNTPARFWRRLRAGGVHVRAFNRPQLTSALGWLSRDHRKVVTVDGRVGFVSGLCVGDMWVGDRARGREPWRDTGVEISGPAVAHIERAFRAAWSSSSGGRAVPPGVPPVGPCGDVSLRVVAAEPQQGALYRLDKLVAALARERLYLTDAYFVGGTSYIQALIAAAQDGVDVRLLVPGASDLPLVRSLSRAGYRPLLEGGVRVFEWNGTMLHAKTAVADGHWARVGSTNLNPASWIGNYELDVAIEHDGVAAELEQLFIEDLQHSTEIVLHRRHRIRLAQGPQPRSEKVRRGRGRTRRLLVGMAGAVDTAGAAARRRRPVGPAEAKVLAATGITFVLLALVGVLYPRAVAYPLAAVGAWVAVSLLVRAAQLRSGPQEASDVRRVLGP